MSASGRVGLNAYDGNLARGRLSAALAELLAAQEYLLRGNSDLGTVLIRRVQRAINSIRDIQDSVLNCEEVTS